MTLAQKQVGNPPVKGTCPSCGLTALFLGDGGFVTCASLRCKAPAAASDLLAEPHALRDRIAAAIRTGEET